MYGSMKNYWLRSAAFGCVRLGAEGSAIVALYAESQLGLPPDADGNGNYAFFDAANYAAIFWGNYAELCSKFGIMLELLRLNSGASYGSATVISPLCDRNGRALSTAGVPSCLEHPVSSN